MSSNSQRKQVSLGHSYEAAAPTVSSTAAATVMSSSSSPAPGIDAKAGATPAPVMLDAAKQSAIARQVGDYNHVLDTIGPPNYYAIKSLLSGEGCPPADSTPAINVSFELFEAIQARFAATKQTLERTKADLLLRNQQYTTLQGELATLKEEYAILQRRATEAEDRNTQLHQQAARQEVTAEQLRRELGQVRVEMDQAQERLVRREEELQGAHHRIAEGLVTLTQKDGVIATLRRELGKHGRFAQKKAGDGAGGDGEEDGGAYTAEALQNIAADVEGRTQEARMKLSVADAEAKLRRAEHERSFILDQHNQYLRHVEDVVAAYESQCMALEDGVASHMCAPTPYFLSASVYAELLAARKSLQEDAGGEDEEFQEHVRSFGALTLDARGSLDRLNKISVDSTSQLKDELATCIDAQRTTLQVGADLIGFLATFEKEVNEDRLSLPEVREEWTKARVPAFATKVAQRLSHGVSTLSTALVQLLERENDYAAAVANAEAGGAAAAAAATSDNAAERKKRQSVGAPNNQPPRLTAMVHAGTMTDPIRHKHRSLQAGPSAFDDETAVTALAQGSVGRGDEGSEDKSSVAGKDVSVAAVAAPAATLTAVKAAAATEEKCLSPILACVIDRACSPVAREGAEEPDDRAQGEGGVSHGPSSPLAYRNAGPAEAAVVAVATPLRFCPKCHYSLTADADAAGTQMLPPSLPGQPPQPRPQHAEDDESADVRDGGERTATVGAPAGVSSEATGTAIPSAPHTEDTVAEAGAARQTAGNNPGDEGGAGSSPANTASPLGRRGSTVAQGGTGGVGEDDRNVNAKGDGGPAGDERLGKEERRPREDTCGSADARKACGATPCPSSPPSSPPKHSRPSSAVTAALLEEKERLTEAVSEYQQELQTAQAELEELRAFKASILTRTGGAAAPPAANGAEENTMDAVGQASHPQQHGGLLSPVPQAGALGRGGDGPSGSTSVTGDDAAAAVLVGSPNTAPGHPNHLSSTADGSAMMGSSTSSHSPRGAPPPPPPGTQPTTAPEAATPSAAAHGQLQLPHNSPSRSATAAATDVLTEPTPKSPPPAQAGGAVAVAPSGGVGKTAAASSVANKNVNAGKAGIPTAAVAAAGNGGGGGTLTNEKRPMGLSGRGTLNARAPAGPSGKLGKTKAPGQASSRSHANGGGSAASTHEAQPLSSLQGAHTRSHRMDANFGPGASPHLQDGVRSSSSSSQARPYRVSPIPAIARESDCKEVEPASLARERRSVAVHSMCFPAGGDAGETAGPNMSAPPSVFPSSRYGGATTTFNFLAAAAGPNEGVDATASSSVTGDQGHAYRSPSPAPPQLSLGHLARSHLPEDTPSALGQGRGSRREPAPAHHPAAFPRQSQQQGQGQQEQQEQQGQREQREQDLTSLIQRVLCGTRLGSDYSRASAVAAPLVHVQRRNVFAGGAAGTAASHGTFGRATRFPLQVQSYRTSFSGVGTGAPPFVSLQGHSLAVTAPTSSGAAHPTLLPPHPPMREPAPGSATLKQVGVRRGMYTPVSTLSASPLFQQQRRLQRRQHQQQHYVRRHQQLQHLPPQQQQLLLLGKGRGEGTPVALSPVITSAFSSPSNSRLRSQAFILEAARRNLSGVLVKRPLFFKGRAPPAGQPASTSASVPPPTHVFSSTAPSAFTRPDGFSRLHEVPSHTVFLTSTPLLHGSRVVPRSQALHLVQGQSLTNPPRVALGAPASQRQPRAPPASLPAMPGARPAARPHPPP